ncbi:uncharacterized protein LOC62_01G001182 [Vanrija pseudolonga]|uniref:Uncharacterized protein n=1 Tax=Vanrija pseudolonga TaxID=143232 RepID=A0AAF0Y0C1_9TREE|nr:hypothetical protein LOC62_01G001182 [Vanrija pseudolonga]
MPVSFAPGPHPSSSRRASASSPYPGRVMTSLVPQDLPSPPRKKRSSSSGSSPSSPHGKPTPPASPLDDPFTDDRNTMSIPPRRESVACYERACRAACSPQADFSVPYTDDTEHAARSPRASSRDPERVPLLGVDEDEESPRRFEWRVTAIIALAILIITAVILGVFRLIEA